MIHCVCPHCGTELEIAEEYAGQTGACGQCNNAFTVPMASSSPVYVAARSVPPTLPTQESNGMAIASLVLGILSFACLSVLCSVPAVILGHMALSRAKRSSVPTSGKGLAVAGLSIGYANIMMSIFLLLPMIAAIAIPNLLRSRIQSNESGAIGNLRTIVGAEVAYFAEKDAYASDFDALTTSVPPYLDGQWLAPKNGYVFALKATDDCFEATATPAEPDRTGFRSFFADCTGVIRYNASGVAPSGSDPPIGE